MEKTGFYCIKCKVVPLIQIIPKSYDIKIFCCCKCSKKLINFDNFINKYFVKNIDYDKISNEPIYGESTDKDNKKILDKNIDIQDIKKKNKQISDKIYEFISEIKTKTINLLESYINEIKQCYEINIKNNQKLDKLIDILLKNYESNEKNNSNIKNVLYNTSFNLGYLNNYSNRFNFNNRVPVNNLIKDVKELFAKTYILSYYNEQLYTYKKFFNHSNSVNCLIELTPNGIASCSKDSFINIYNLESKKSLYKYQAHNNGVFWMDKIYKNYIISTGEDYLLKIWPNPNLNYEANVNSNGYYSVTFSEEISIVPITIFNLIVKFTKFILVKENHIILCGYNRILLLKYELIKDDKNEDNLLNVNFIIIKDIMIVNNFVIDFLIFQNDKNQEFIFYLGSLKVEIFSIPNLSVVYEHKEYTKNISLNCLTQLNNDEIIYANGFEIKIFNLNYFKIKFTYKNSKDITSLTKLKDNTLLISTSSGITRIETKHFEEISLISMIYSNYNNYLMPQTQKEKIEYIYIFEDGKMGICSSFGNIKICKFNLA